MQNISLPSLKLLFHLGNLRVKYSKKKPSQSKISFSCCLAVAPVPPTRTLKLLAFSSYHFEIIFYIMIHNLCCTCSKLSISSYFFIISTVVSPFGKLKYCFRGFDLPWF